MKTNKTWQNQTGQSKMDGDITNQATVQAFSASTGQVGDSESDRNSDQLDTNLLLCTQHDNE